MGQVLHPRRVVKNLSNDLSRSPAPLEFDHAQVNISASWFAACQGDGTEQLVAKGVESSGEAIVVVD